MMLDGTAVGPGEQLSVATLISLPNRVNILWRILRLIMQTFRVGMAKSRLKSGNGELLLGNGSDSRGL